MMKLQRLKRGFSEFCTKRVALPLVFALAIALALSISAVAQDNSSKGEDEAPRFIFQDEWLDDWKAALESRHGMLIEYRGPLRAHPDIVSLRQSVTHLRSRNLAQLAVQLGLPSSFKPRCLWVICDEPKGHPSRSCMETWTHELDGQKTAVIRIYAGALISRKCKAFETFTHECVHGLMNEYLGDTSIEADWFHEGVALALAGQVAQRCRNLLVHQVWSSERLTASADIPDALSDGIEDPIAYEDYAEAALRVKYLTQKHGMRSIPQIMEAVRKGKSFQEALVEVTSCSLAEFSLAARNFARQHLYTILGDTFLGAARLTEAYRIAKGLEGERRANAFSELAEDLNARDANRQMRVRGHLNKPIAEYVLLVAHIEGGKNEEARTLYQREIESGGSFNANTFTLMASMAAAKLALKTKDLDLARDLRPRLLYGFSYDQRAKKLVDELSAMLEASASDDAGPKDE